MQQLSMTQKQTMTSALRVEYFSTAWMAFEWEIAN
ncbi:cation transporter, partial [Lactiplantibacillus plantarum]|nr:cation transporter [Lactiplantibacillus plantarum]MCZ9397626.1 cation transporter [Lactiplantibacillus plantarum]